MARKREAINPVDAGEVKDKRNRKRFITYGDENGIPDMSTVPPEMRPFVSSNIPTDTPQSDPSIPPPADFNPAIFQMLLPMVVALEAAVVAPRLNIDTAETRLILTPSPQIADGIAAAAAKVATKYAAPLGRWADEIALAALIIIWQTSAFAELHRLQARTAPKIDPRPPSVEKHESYQPDPVIVPPPVEVKPLPPDDLFTVPAGGL